MQRVEQDNTKPPRFMVTLTTDQNDHATKASKKAGMSRSAYVRKILDRDMENGNDRFTFRVRYLDEDNETLDIVIKTHTNLIDWLNSHDYPIVDMQFIRKPK